MGGDKPSENLANLLESHDIAKVRTGLSMIDTMEEIPLEQILWLQLMHNESEIRKTAKSILGKKDFQNEGTQTQIDAINLIVKENWKANYRTTKGKIGTNLCNLENKLNSIDFTIFANSSKLYVSMYCLPKPFTSEIRPTKPLSLPEP